MSATSLEERIAAALTCDHSSAELAALVCETEAAIDAAAQNATLVRLLDRLTGLNRRAETGFH
jgi:hypothetical protein